MYYITTLCAKAQEKLHLMRHYYSYLCDSFSSIFSFFAI